MKTPTHFQEGNTFYQPDTKEKYPRDFHGHPELVKFPSTSEVFHAVFENTFYASCIGSGEEKRLRLMKLFAKFLVIRQQK